MANTKKDPWRYWRQELAGVRQERDCVAAAEGLIAGYWRTAGAATKCDWPLAILPSPEHGDRLRAIFGAGIKATYIVEGTPEWDEFLGGGSWLGCSAVTYEEHQSAVQGGFWADGRPARPMDTLEKRGFKRGTGDDAQTEAERLANAAGDAAARLKEVGFPIRSQEAADEAASIRTFALALEKEAKNLHEGEKKPVLQLGREIDARWRAVTDACREVIADARLQIADWMASQKPNDPTAPPVAVGKVGEKVVVRKTKEAVITDYAALLAAVSDHAEVRTAVSKVANASARAGIALPGMRIEEKEQVV
jgi:hypothetical protein